MKLTNNILTEMIKQQLFERRVALSGQKDANFGSDYVQLMGKAGMLKLTKKVKTEEKLSSQGALTDHSGSVEK